MKITNQKIIPLVQLLYLLLGISIFAFLFLFFLEEFSFKNLKIYTPLVLAILFIILIKSLGKPYFFYDSSGETLNISNKKFSIIPNNLSFVNKAEFPKSKLHSFKISSFLWIRRLELYLHSKKSQNGISKLKYDISYLGFNTVSDLKKSLNKVVNENKKTLQ